MSAPKDLASPDPSSPKSHVDSSDSRSRLLESSTSLFAADPASLFFEPDMRSLAKSEKSRESYDETTMGSNSSRERRLPVEDESDRKVKDDNGNLDESNNHGAEDVIKTDDPASRRALRKEEEEEESKAFSGDENTRADIVGKRPIHQEEDVSDVNDDDDSRNGLLVERRSPRTNPEISRENGTKENTNGNHLAAFHENALKLKNDEIIDDRKGNGAHTQRETQAIAEASEELPANESTKSEDEGDDKSRLRRQTIESEQDDVDDEKSESSDSKKDEAPRFLKEKTMALVKGRLLTKQEELDPIVTNNSCDEDEIMAFMLKIEDNAEKQTSLLVHHRMAQKALTRRNENSEDSSSYDEEDDEETARLVDQFRKYEEEQSLGKELFSRVIHKVTKEEMAKLSPTTKRSKKNLKYNLLDKRTLGWVKKAAGISGSEIGVTGAVSNMSAASTVLPDHPAFRDSLDDHGRRFTRGMAQKHKRKRDHKKKPPNHLDSLVGALTDVEEIWGTKIPPFKRRYKKTKQSKSTQNHLDQQEQIDETVGRKRARSRVDDESAIKRKKKDALESNITGTFDPFDLDTVPGPIHSTTKLHEWLLRNETGDARKEDEYVPIIASDPNRSLPAQIRKGGMVARDLPWAAQNPRRKQASQNIPLLRPERREEYAMYCDMIFSSLSGKARQRARFEFFYSELDKGWFQRSDFVEQAKRLGIPSGIELTPGEWKGIRRTLARKTKPRRFSKKFVEDKRKDLERYRRFVRLLQGNSVPEAGEEYRLDPGESVPSRIPVGAVVTAFNSKFRVLQRGVVLSFETARNLYLVRFPPGYGNLFCPDYEIVRHGLPSTFVPGQSHILGHSTRELQAAPSAIPNSAGTGTSEQDVSEVFSLQKWKPLDATDPVTACKQADQLLDHMKPFEMVSQPAEREMLAIVLATMEDARTRKSKILDCIRHLQRSSRQMDADDRRHYAWLMVNLEKVNLTLKKGAFYMKTLYGPCYEPNGSSLDTRHSLEDIMAWAFRAKHEGFKRMRPSINAGADELNDWSRRLLLDSEDICRRILDDLTKQHEDEDGRFILESIAPIGTFLLASSYMEHSLPDIVNVHGTGAILKTSQGVLEGLPIPDDAAFTETNRDESSEQYSNAISNHKLAIQDLKDAINDWTSEMAMQSLFS